MVIGLKRGTVKLVEHDPAWEQEFQREVVRLKELLPNELGPYEHIGSTSIPGIPAKPIIDFMVGTDDISQAFELEALLESAGYEHRSNGDNEERVLFVRGPEECRTHHFSFVTLGSKQWRQSVGFRDLLRVDRELAHRYAELKRELEQKYSGDRASYTEAKQPFFKDVFARL